jgi:hypothetical protein
MPVLDEDVRAALSAWRWTVKWEGATPWGYASAEPNVLPEE